MPLTPTTFVTRRLTLTPLEEGDAEAMLAVYGDDRMYEFTGGQAPSLSALRTRYRFMAVGNSPDGTQLWLNWIVRLDGQAVGAVQATVTADGSSADVAWEVGVRWQGDGVATEAASAVVDWLVGAGVATIQAMIHPDHAASAAVATRIGLAPTTDLEDGEVVWRRTTGSPH